MVYETDFYTVRRPYTRPTITSYTVTGCRPCSWRIAPVSPAGAHSKVRMSVLLGELNRIQNRPRMHLSYVPTEDFLNSRPLVEFDDETKYIRAEADKLMRYIYVPVPHQTSRLPLKVTTSYDRFSSNGLNPYIRSGRDVSNNILNLSYYNEPSRATIGRGHLACVTFAGGRGYPRRKHLFADEYRDIGDEIKVRSFYNKNIQQHNKGVEDALALPTGFASRLLTTERKAYSTGENDRKPNAITRIKRSEKPTPTTNEETSTISKSEILDEIKPKYNKESKKKENKFSDDIVTTQFVDNKKEISSQPILQENKSKTEEIFNDVETDPIVTPKEKLKSKKEHQRKLSQESEVKEVPSRPKISREEKLNEEIIPTYEKKEEIVPTFEKKEEDIDKQEFIAEIEDKLSNNEEYKSEVTEHVSPIEEKIVSEPNDFVKESPLEEEQIKNETIVEKEVDVPLEEKSIPEEILETTEEKIWPQEESDVALNEIAAETEEKIEVKTIENVNDNQEQNTEELIEDAGDTVGNVEDIASTQENEDLQKEVQLVSEAEQKVANEDENDTLAELKTEDLLINEEVKDETPAVEYPTEETDIFVQKEEDIDETGEILIEPTCTDVINESITTSSDVEPIIEEPITPEGINVQFPDQYNTTE